MKRLVLLGAIAALVLAASASADEEVVRHGRSIGKVQLGMSLAQVRGLLGRERAVNIRERRGTLGYVCLELDWDYGWWTVGFMRRGKAPFEAVLIGTGQRVQRTPEGFGLGTYRDQLRRRLAARCREVVTPRGAIRDQECVHGDTGRPQTVFVLDTYIHLGENDLRVRYVEVRDPLFYLGWRVRFRPS